MKKLFVLLSALVVSMNAFASEKMSAEKGQGFELLERVVGIQQTYSKTSELEAKVVELLAGDGVNPTRMVLVLNSGMAEKSKVYSFDFIMMYQVTRVTFLAKDVIVINYLQDSFEGPDFDKQVQIKKSLKVTALRDASGALSDEILTEDISK